MTYIQEKGQLSFQALPCIWASMSYMPFNFISAYIRPSLGSFHKTRSLWPVYARRNGILSFQVWSSTCISHLKIQAFRTPSLPAPNHFESNTTEEGHNDLLSTKTWHCQSKFTSSKRLQVCLMEMPWICSFSSFVKAFMGLTCTWQPFNWSWLKTKIIYIFW